MTKERTVYEGLAPDAKVSPELISAWEETVAKLDEEIAQKHKARAAYTRLIIDGRKRLSEPRK